MSRFRVFVASCGEGAGEEPDVGLGRPRQPGEGKGHPKKALHSVMRPVAVGAVQDEAKDGHAPKARASVAEALDNPSEAFETGGDSV